MRQPASQPWHTFPFWFLLFAGVGLTAAWKLDLLPGHRPAPDGVASLDLGEEVDLQDVPTDRTAKEGRWDVPTEESLPDSLIAGQQEPVAVSTSRPDPLPRIQPGDTARRPAPGSARRGSAGSNPFSIADAEFRASDSAFNNLSTRRVPPPSMGEDTTAAYAHEAPSAPLQTAALDEPRPRARIVPSAYVEGHEHSRVTPAGGDETDSFSPAKFDFATIDALIESGNDVEANYELSNLYWKRPGLRPQLLPRLQQVSHRIYFQSTNHYMDPYEVQPGDVLQTVAREYGVPWQYLAKLNRTKPERIRPGQKLKVIEGPFSAVVDLSDFRMTIHAHGHFVGEFAVGIGRDGTTPIGKFTVKEKLADPTYYGPEGVVSHDDPNNPLGEYWLDLGDSYGIHGTIDPDSIGKADSKGCIRLRDADIAAVYDLLGIGSEVLIKR
jgi:lipoprotein-anchoring transpeptidase ErfK/SrfK